jgi:thiol-disulfide isomerase/thioredoxin
MRFYADYPDNIEEIHEGLIETLENDYPEKIAAWDIAAPQEVARRFTFEFRDVLTGRTVSSAELEGKVLVIDFWATWCGPCRSEIPHMLELYEKYRDRNVEFIGISLDKNSEELKSFCEKRGMSWPQHCVDGKTWDTELSRKWGVRSIPAMFVIDRRNHIVTTDARGRLESIIEKTLAE